MLSPKDLARIVKDEIENEMRKDIKPVEFYYILLDGKIYPQNDYDKEVAEGKRSPNDIYAYVDEWHTSDFDDFLLYANYLADSSVEDVAYAYLRKVGFTIKCSVVKPPTPNLKYYINAVVELNSNSYTPEYLVINIYDIDALARTLHIPQIVQQRLGNKPREITYDDADDIWRTVTEKQPILAGYTYTEAWSILNDYSAFHGEAFKDEAHKIVLAYIRQFPSPYQVCYEWEARRFDKIDCLKLELRRFSS